MKQKTLRVDRAAAEWKMALCAPPQAENPAGQDSLFFMRIESRRSLLFAIPDGGKSAKSPPVAYGDKRFIKRAADFYRNTLCFLERVFLAGG